MLTNLFSMFDNNMYVLDPIKMMFICFLLVVMSKSNKTILCSKKNMIKALSMNKIFMEMEKELILFKSHQNNIKTKGSFKILIFLFISIFFFNYTSLYPYVLSSTSHMSLNLTLTLNLWLLSVCFGLIISYKNFLAHLTPSGTPIFLMSFMVLIETISNIIRPLTLAVRLMANMVAGHLLLTLLSKFSLTSFKFTFFCTPVFFILGVLEIGVSIIQAYVIMLLCFLYLKESF